MRKRSTQASGEETTLKSRKSRQYLSPEKKFQIFLEAQHSDKPTAEILRREGLYSSDLTRIRQQVKEGAMERLGCRTGKRKETVPAKEYKALRRELEDKERTLADLTVELAILRKKTNGGSWDR
jgi:transposase-like protein